jgi:hypothetical protein
MLYAGLKLKRDGSVVVSSESHVRVANKRIVFLTEQIELQTKSMREERDKLKAAVEQYVIDAYEPGEGYEDETVKLTKVVSHRCTWNADKLRKLLPTSLYKLVIDVKVNDKALDELCREGKIDRKKIASAFEEVPNAPYTRRTVKGTPSGKDEAAALAAKLA